MLDAEMTGSDETRPSSSHQTSAPRRPNARALPNERFVPMPKPKPFLIGLSIAALLSIATASNVQKYLTDGATMEVPLAGAVVLALIATLMSRPRGVGAAGWLIGLMLIEAIMSIKHEWSGTPMSEIIKNLMVVAFSAGCFFVGISLRQNATSRQMLNLELLAMALLAFVVICSLGILRTQKNVMGGTAFELVMFASALEYGRVRTLRHWHGLITGGLIMFSAFLVNHRAMIGIGAFVAFCLTGFTFYRPRFARAVPPVAAICVAIGAIIALTIAAQSEQMAYLNVLVKQNSGRELMSGRQTFWGTLVDGIINGPMLGHGPTAIAFDLTGMPFSTHNGFLQVALSYGPIGLAIVLVLLAFIAKRAISAPITSAGAFLSTALAAIIIHNSSENALFQNVFGVAAMGWLVIGFLYASCNLSVNKNGNLMMWKSGRGRPKTIKVRVDKLSRNQ